MKPLTGAASESSTHLVEFRGRYTSRAHAVAVRSASSRSPDGGHLSRAEPNQLDGHFVFLCQCHADLR